MYVCVYVKEGVIVATSYLVSYTAINVLMTLRVWPHNCLKTWPQPHHKAFGAAANESHAHEANRLPYSTMV